MARRNRPKEKRVPHSPVISRFDEKRKQQERGEIPVFQFADSSRPEPDAPHVWTTPTVRLFNDTRKRPCLDPATPVVSATVTDIRRLRDGYVFLTDTDGGAIYLSMKVWDEAHSKLAIPVGTVIECQTQTYPNAKNPRVTRVLHVTPA